MATAAILLVAVAGNAGAGRVGCSGSPFSVTDAAGADPQYFFTFDIAGIEGYGSLNVTGLGPTFAVTGGTLVVTNTVDAGNYTLYANPNSPYMTTSPNNAYNYDDLLSPASNPTLDAFGLLFIDDTNAQHEASIWANGANDYTFDSWKQGVWTYNQVNSGGAFTLTAVPEASSIVLLLPGLLPVALVLRRRVRKA